MRIIYLLNSRVIRNRVQNLITVLKRKTEVQMIACLTEIQIDEAAKCFIP